jgi:hypothetical protein
MTYLYYALLRGAWSICTGINTRNVGVLVLRLPYHSACDVQHCNFQPQRQYTNRRCFAGHGAGLREFGNWKYSTRTCFQRCLETSPSLILRRGLISRSSVACSPTLARTMQGRSSDATPSVRPRTTAVTRAYLLQSGCGPKRLSLVKPSGTVKLSRQRFPCRNTINLAPRLPRDLFLISLIFIQITDLLSKPLTIQRIGTSTDCHPE